MNVTECKAKKGSKLKAQKHIYSCPVRQMFTRFKHANPDTACSLSMFYKCKPFYVLPASNREMESCLCGKCLNPHSLYNSLKRCVKDLPASLSDYLTMYFQCQRDTNIDFPDISCINGNCKNGCQILNESNTDQFSSTKHVSYYQFESKDEFYFDKNGKRCVYKRIARQDYSKPVKDVYNLLMASAKNYLTHRYNVLTDRIYWQCYLADTKDAVVWMDYSMNIKLTERDQVQSAHFSGRQQTLHDSLIDDQGKHTYIYHLSDDTTHDSVMTKRIIEEIIISHPEIIRSGVLQLRSDNCAAQYKSRFVFKALLELAAKYKIRINWFFGEAGHGRGLIDAMAWFGCKGPLRKEIITSGSWFANANEMYSYLQRFFASDDSKEYHLLSNEENAKIRSYGREERVVEGCKSAHVMSFFADGEMVKKWTSVKSFIDELNGSPTALVEEHDDSEEDLDYAECGEMVDQVWEGSVELMDLYGLIDIGSCVAIRSQPNNLELFHVMKVLSKGIASENMIDQSGEHSVLKNEPYLCGVWVAFMKDTRKYAQFKESKTSAEALIHISEVFSTNLALNEKMQMDISDYHMLACA